MLDTRRKLALDSQGTIWKSRKKINARRNKKTDLQNINTWKGWRKPRRNMNRSKQNREQNAAPK